MHAWRWHGECLRVRQSRAVWMNSAVLSRDGHVVVVDPGVAPSELDDLAAVVAGLAASPEHVTLVLTHHHWDHVLGRPWFPRARTAAHGAFAGSVAREAGDIERSARAWIEGEGGERWATAFAPFTPDEMLRDGTACRLGDFDVVAHHIPGHCTTQLALHVPELHLLLAADTLSDLEIPWLEEPAWIHRHSLERLQRVIEDEGVETLVPGHGAIAEGAAACRRRVHDDLDYLRRLEQGVADAVARGDSLERTQEVLAAMPYTGRDAAYAMNDVHRGNIAHTWHGLRARGGHADA